MIASGRVTDGRPVVALKALFGDRITATSMTVNLCELTVAHRPKEVMR